MALKSQPKRSLNHTENSKQQGYGSGYDQQGDEKTGMMNLEGSKFKDSPVIQRGRAVSEPKSQICSPRPPPPSHPPPPNPRLSKLISDFDSVHIIDSRSRANTPPVSRPVASAVSTMKYHTPPPRPPAPPPPKGKQKEEKGSPRVENVTSISTIPKLQTLSLPILKCPTTSNHYSVDSFPTESKKQQEKDSIKEEGDRSVRVYEDLDEDDDSKELKFEGEELEPHPTGTLHPQNDLSSGGNAIPPALPPKKGLIIKVKQSKEEELVPPLSPRSLPPSNVRKHRLLKNDGEVLNTERKEPEEEDKEALQKTGDYEPVNYHEADKESQGSDDSYTEMYDPGHSDDDLGKMDEPEDIYITMDPHSYIPPPADYKPKKKKKRTIGNKNNCKIE